MRVLLRLLVAAAVALPLAGHAAEDFPRLKAGQWEMTIEGSKGAPASKTILCTDDAVQKELIRMGTGMQKDMCSKNDMRREGPRVISVSTCKIGESTVDTRAVMTFTGDTAYRTEIESTYAPPFMGMKEAKSVMEGRHVGPCRNGLVPGDMLLPGGQKLNIKNIGAAKAPATTKAK